MIFRPVLVPICSVNPFRRRALAVKSTPCQYLREVAEVGLAGDVVAGRARAGGQGLRVERHRVAAAIGQTRVGRRRQRERLVVGRAARQVVGDEAVGGARSRPPAAVVADLHRHARQHLLLHVDAPLPVVLPDAPAAQQLRVDLRDVLGGATEVQVVARQRAARVHASASPGSGRPGSCRSQSITKSRSLSVQLRSSTWRTVLAAGLFCVYTLSLVAASR